MLCYLCGRKIGFPRSLVDQQYCSSNHRREARLASSQALRDEDDFELWSVSKSRRKAGRSATTAQTASIFAILTVGGLLVAALMTPGAGAAHPAVSTDPGTRQGLLQRGEDAIGEIIRHSAPITIQTDFHSGLADWTSVALHGFSPGDGPHSLVSAAAPNLVSPGSLRLWKRSTSLVNYQMEFQGQIEKKSLSWAFRATDQNNYYATKILIARPGPLPNAGLLRYAVVNGREWDRLQLPLPLTLERGGKYRVRVSIQDDRFITYLNGQVISSWSDKRLRRGGVGFFADDDDEQQVAWVSLSERDSILGRMMAHFSLFVMPGPAK